MLIKLPQLSLVVLVGPSGSGKSTFARKHFLGTEVLSSDYFRGLVSDDENDQSVSDDAFAALYYVLQKRLTLGKLTVVDATNVQLEDREKLLRIAREHHFLSVAIVMNLHEKVCHERNRDRPDRQFGEYVIRRQRGLLRRSLGRMRREGFQQVFVFDTPEQVDAVEVQRIPMWTDRRHERGPFDIIGDVHGCADELEELLGQLGYVPQPIDAQPSGLDTADDPAAESLPAESPPAELFWSNNCYAHPEGRRVIFLGDLVDRGPRNLDVLRIVEAMVRTGRGICVPGNHDMKFLKKLQGHDVRIAHGLAETLAEIDALPEATRAADCQAIARFLDSMISHFVLDDGKLVVAHAGMKQQMQGRGSRRVREFALYGETTGEIDDFGLPVRLNWASDYRGQAMVVYGHTPVGEPQWLNRTVNIDTGCVFGGKLTALRYPERELVSVPAQRMYCVSKRPFLPEDSPGTELTAQQQHDDMLDAQDVLGKRRVQTPLQGLVTIGLENATAALEVMSRFAADPKWLIYLPPTMSPCETSHLPGFLEHPAEAFAYFRNQGISRVVCEEKHMGSRAVVVIGRDADAVRTRFGITSGESGIVYTRTGRPFFNDSELHAAFVNRLRRSLDAAGFWDAMNSSWACLDCELMPWSAKAQELLRGQYAAVGAAASGSLPPTLWAMEAGMGRLTGDEQARLAAVRDRFQQRSRSIGRYVEAYRRYCWPVESLEGWKLAPFHLLATEGKVHIDQDHVWHMETLAKICQHDPNFLLATEFRVVDLADPESEAAATDWWVELTARGGEGMVVKPYDWIARGNKGLSQPAVKCRGSEYLRIIYGPDYDTEQNLERLRRRGLGRKRSLASREFALGVEALERFVKGEPLRQVHECVFGVLALESEPVDPRL